MNQILSSPQTLVDLASSAVIVHVPVTVYTGKMSDAKLADEVSADKGANERVVEVTHDLFVKDLDLRNLLNHRQLVTAWLKRECYPWAGSLWLLPAYKLEQFGREYQAWKDKHEELLNKFIATLDDKISRAMFIRGPMANKDDYPDATWLRRRFTMQMTVMEVPMGDFRNAVAADAAQDLKANFEQQAQQYVLEITTKQTEVLKDLLTRLRDNCDTEMVTKADGSTVVKRKRLHSSTVRQAIECCERIERFNITQDPQLESIRKQLAQVLDGVDADTVSDNLAKREEIKNECDAILAKF